MIKVSETLNEAIKNFLNFSPSVASHMENRENPHGVTKDQVGLSNVENVKLTSLERFEDHVEGKADNHSGNDIMYSEGKSVNEKINEIIIDGGGGTMYHNEMLNRSSENAHPIEAITGLRDEIGATLVFEGTTNNNSKTALSCTTESSEFLDEYGDIVLPEKTAAVFDISVIGIVLTDSGNISNDSALWHTKALAFRFGNFLYPYIISNNMTDVRQQDTSTSVEIYGGRAISPAEIKVVGLEDTEMYWRAEVKITNVINVD